MVGLVSGRRRPSLLDHFVRGQIYQTIKNEPGIHYAEILRQTGLSNGSGSHHLRVLEKGGYIRVVLDRAKTRFYLTDAHLNPEDYGLSDGDRAVLDAVEETPGVEQREISKRLGMSSTRVSRSVARLGLLGFVRSRREGRSRLVFPLSEGGAGLP
jgi:predicted transcriptional regulator